MQRHFRGPPPGYDLLRDASAAYSWSSVVALQLEVGARSREGKRQEQQGERDGEIKMKMEMDLKRDHGQSSQQMIPLIAAHVAFGLHSRLVAVQMF